MKSATRIVLLVSVCLIANAVAAAEPSVVIDESCCLRRYHRFGADLVSPTLMRSQGQQILGQTLFDRLKRDSERSLGTSGNDNFAVFRPSPLVLRQARRTGTIEAMKRVKPTDAAAADWRDLQFRRMFFDPYTAPTPPSDWADAAFDDSGWVVGRGPFQIGLFNDLPPEATTGNMAKVHVDSLQFIGAGLFASHYRGRFVVNDPSKVGDLTFQAAYRGGIRVLINGHELVRRHLPAGELAPDAAGEEYPAEAYADSALRDRMIAPLAVPNNLLRPGANVLAIEVRTAPLHPLVLKTPLSKSWNALHDREGVWRHGALGSFKLTCPTGAVGLARTRPAGLIVWAADIHQRVQSDDVPAPGEGRGVVRIAGPQNATCSGQIVVSTTEAVGTLKVTVGELKSGGAGGATIPDSAIKALHMLPYPADGFNHKLGDERGLGGSFPSQQQLTQLAGWNDAKTVVVFDQITERVQAVPANASRAIWLSVRIPADAAAGTYRGAAQVQADNRPAVSVPVELEVIGWRAPEPKDFGILVGLEQNPYAVARQYGVKLWSDEHLRLLSASFAQLGRAGNRWLNVPVIRGSEFGNRDDSPIRWVRRKDGTLTYDFSTLDKYLDAAKAQGPSRIINVVIMPGMSPAGWGKPAPSEVMVFDEASGKSAPMATGGANVTPADKKRIWTPFATAMYQHLKAKGLDKALHWGYPLDGEVDPELVAMLGDLLPAVKWTGGPHQLGGYKKPQHYDSIGTVRYFDNFPPFRMSMGWKSPVMHLTIPRVDSSVQSLTTASHPFAFRLLVDHSLALGRVGFTRVGADEWASAHYDGMQIPQWIVGMPVLFMLWPGRDGAESSARFECLIEGIQEGEARLFLERALDAGRLPPDLARRVREVLADRFTETGFMQKKLCVYEMEQYHYRWQERSRQLYQAAAEVAGSPVSGAVR